MNNDLTLLSIIIGVGVLSYLWHSYNQILSDIKTQSIPTKRGK